MFVLSPADYLGASPGCRISTLHKTVIKCYVADSLCFVANFVNTVDTDKTRQSCLVRVGGVNNALFQFSHHHNVHVYLIQYCLRWIMRAQRGSYLNIQSRSLWPIQLHAEMIIR